MADWQMLQREWERSHAELVHRAKIGWGAGAFRCARGERCRSSPERVRRFVTMHLFN